MKIILTLCLSASLCLSGCANTPSFRQETVTKAMVIVPTKPTSPNPETADQREIALYIILLRDWGNKMAIQLQAIDKLISPEDERK